MTMKKTSDSSGGGKRMVTAGYTPSPPPRPKPGKGADSRKKGK